MKKMVALVVFACLALQVVAGSLVSKREFTQRYVAVVAQLFPGAKSTISGELEVEVTLPGSDFQRSFLDNAYANYTGSPDDLDEILKYYAGVLNINEELAKAEFSTAQIFPTIKNKTYIEHVSKLIKESGKKGGLVYDQLNEELFVVYAYDTPKAIRFISEQDLIDNKVDRDTLLTLAKKNLKRAIADVTFEGDPNAISMLIADGTYEASFILFEQLWTKERFPVNGDIVVYVPARDVVVITGSKDAANLHKVRRFIYDSSKQWSHPITQQGFVRKAGRWEVFQP